MQLYNKVITLRISKVQKQTLDKIKDRNFNVQNFIRKAIAEKIERDYKELQPKPKNQYCPF